MRFRDCERYLMFVAAKGADHRNQCARFLAHISAHVRISFRNSCGVRESMFHSEMGPTSLPRSMTRSDSQTMRRCKPERMVIEDQVDFIRGLPKWIRRAILEKSTIHQLLDVLRASKSRFAVRTTTPTRPLPRLYTLSTDSGMRDLRIHLCCCSEPCVQTSCGKHEWSHPLGEVRRRRSRLAALNLYRLADTRPASQPCRLRCTGRLFAYVFAFEGLSMPAALPCLYPEHHYYRVAVEIWRGLVAVNQISLRE